MLYNEEGLVTDYIVLSRDHHDVSGTDSPFRETSNIYDGSAFTAGMHLLGFYLLQHILNSIVFLFNFFNFKRHGGTKLHW